ncbi:MAG TPA: hypothetical protein DEA08_14230 [Planctomycetes bacterium]|nr:hypothetical protein [Planctomycetota bacterium]
MSGPPTTSEATPPAGPLARARGAFLALVFAGWAALTVVVGGTLMVGHWVTLPKPEREDAQLLRGLAELRRPGEEERWMAVHVLYADCRCSQRILDGFGQQERPAGAVEKVLLVGRHPGFEETAQRLGFDLRLLEAPELKQRYAIESAPLLLVIDPEGALRYAGGYTSRKQGLDPQDAQVIAALVAGRDPAELPLYGCGVSRELQDLLDPLGVKYD